MWKIANGPKVRVELELLAQRHIDAGEPAADRSRYRTLQRHARAFNRFDQLFGNVLAIFGIGVSARLVRLPFELQAGRFKDAHGRLRDLGSNSVAGDECDSIRHLAFTYLS